MYGRVPRLPVDVMFHNVKRDCDVADYDSYILKLRENLREALSSAQQMQSPASNIRLKCKQEGQMS